MTELTATEQGGPPASVETSAPKPVRKPSKFLADLTKAMQSAAEAAREESVSRLQADAKAAIEEIHGRSSTEAADLRRRADDDVSSIREWSKQEIARVREETETKVSDRKAQLEREIEEHAALIEHQIDRVQGRVTAFETEMAAFFERLLAEDDPTRFAEMAESLPEPPPFDVAELGLSASPSTTAVEDTATRTEAVVEAVVETPEEPAAVETSESAETAGAVAVAEAEPTDETASQPTNSSSISTGYDTEAAMAAIQAAAEAAAVRESETERTSESTDAETTTATQTSEPLDPRLAAFGLSASFDAAEAEAAAAIEAVDDSEDIPVIADDALAARLAGLVPAAEAEANGATPDTRVTQVVVTGLVSVASIASFKRHLGRMAGVASVGVTSGPEGEFVFAVTHGPDLVLRDAVPAMPGFQARVTGGNDNTVEVTARDPESEG